MKDLGFATAEDDGVVDLSARAYDKADDMTGIGFFGGLAALAGIGGGRDTYTTTSTGGTATVALIVVLGVLLVLLVYVGLGGGKGKR